MRRDISEINILEKFAIDFCKIVEKHISYIIVSGFVAIASGRTRGTEDIDMITGRMTCDSFCALHKALAQGGFVCMQSDDPKEIHSYLSDNLSVRYTQKDEPLPEMEVKFSKDKLDETQLRTRVRLPLTGLKLWFSSINVNIAFKEEYLKSPKDMEDARHLRAVYGDQISEKEISNIKRMIRELRL